MFLKTIKNFSFRCIQLTDLNLAKGRGLENALTKLPFLSIPEGSEKYYFQFYVRGTGRFIVS